MSEANSGPEFLKQRYPGLSNSPEVKNAAKRTGLDVPRLPETLIQNYLDRFKEIITRKDPKEKATGITALKKLLINKYVVRAEDIPDSYWQLQMRIVRERGESGDWQTLPEKEQLELKRKHLAQTKEDQQGSLEEWIDYFVSEKSSYLPDYLKYWTFQGMLRLERYEKGNEEKGIKGRFPERPTGRQRSIKMFPEVNERALTFIKEAFDAQSKNQKPDFRHDIPWEAREQFLEHLSKKDFRSLYGWGQEHIPPISEEEMQNTEGQWVIYSKDSDSKALTAALQGKGSGWCIAGENLAKEYLDRGSLQVYYTRDREGKFTIPRVVIVQKGNQVSEVRGIEWEENVDGYIKDADIIGNKLKEIPGGEEFFEINADTKRLTAIDKKMAFNGLLTREELAFLYETERQIKYFGQEKDPRIGELRSTRNPEEDMPVVFACDKSEITHSVGEINKDTKAYVGPLTPGIFDAIQKYNVEYVYTSFPEGRIRKETLEIGGKSVSKLEQELQQSNINVGEYAKDMLHSKDFTTLPNPEKLDTVRLKVADLLPGNPTIDQIYAKAKELGLELTPAEAGVHYSLKHRDQQLYDYLHMGMKQIADRYGRPLVFRLRRRGGGLWLDDGWAGPDIGWSPGSGFMFALSPPAGEASKSEPKKTWSP